MFILSIFAALARWRRYRRSLRLLASFDDRMLADVGISRGEIPRAARGRR